MTEARKELIERIIALTPEQFERFVNHPEVIQVMKEHEERMRKVSG